MYFDFYNSGLTYDHLERNKKLTIEEKMRKLRKTTTQL